MTMTVKKVEKLIHKYLSYEALESVMCEVIKIRLKSRNATRNKFKLKLHLKLGNPSFKIGRSAAILIFSGWFPFPLLVAILLFRRIFVTSHMTLSSASFLLFTEKL